MMVALSSEQGINVDKLIDVIYSFLPNGPALYPRDSVCDIPQKVVISDIIREKLFNLMKDETASFDRSIY